MTGWETALVSALPGALAFVAAILAAWNAHRAQIHAARDLEETKAARGQITTLQIEINHRLTELVTQAASTGRAEGKAEGVAEEQARQAIKDKARAEGIGEERRAAVVAENKP